MGDLIKFRLGEVSSVSYSVISYQRYLVTPMISYLIYSRCFENCQHHLKRSLMNSKLQRPKPHRIFHSQKCLHIFFPDDITKPCITFCNRFFVVWLTKSNTNQTMKHVETFFLLKQDVDVIFNHDVTHSHGSVQRSQSKWMSKYRSLCCQTPDFRNFSEPFSNFNFFCMSQ